MPNPDPTPPVIVTHSDPIDLGTVFDITATRDHVTLHTTGASLQIGADTVARMYLAIDAARRGVDL